MEGASLDCGFYIIDCIHVYSPNKILSFERTSGSSLCKRLYACGIQHTHRVLGHKTLTSSSINNFTSGHILPTNELVPNYFFLMFFKTFKFQKCRKRIIDCCFEQSGSLYKCFPINISMFTILYFLVVILRTKRKTGEIKFNNCFI